MNKTFLRKDLQDFKNYDTSSSDAAIKLNANESFNDVPAAIKEKFCLRVMKENFNRYPDISSEKLKKLYASYAGICEENIIAGNGSDELIDVSMKAFLNSGDKVLVLEPDFSMYEIYCKVAHGTILQIKPDSDFNYDSERIIELIKAEKPKIFIFSNPNNPSGSVIPENGLIKILNECNCIVIIDEAYYEFYGHTMVKRINEFNNLLILRTLSKAAGIAAARLGFAIGCSEIVNEIKKVTPPYNVNSFTQIIGEMLLEDRSFIENNVKEIVDEKEYLKNELNILGRSEKIKAYKSYANFILIECKDAEQIYKALLKKGILVRDFSGCMSNFLRITVGSRHENDIFIDVLKRISGI